MRRDAATPRPAPASGRSGSGENDAIRGAAGAATRRKGTARRDGGRLPRCFPRSRRERTAEHLTRKAHLVFSNMVDTAFLLVRMLIRPYCCPYIAVRHAEADQDKCRPTVRSPWPRGDGPSDGAGRGSKGLNRPRVGEAWSRVPCSTRSTHLAATRVAASARVRPRHRTVIRCTGAQGWFFTPVYRGCCWGGWRHTATTRQNKYRSRDYII